MQLSNPALRLAGSSVAAARPHRLLKIATLLQNGRIWSCKELAAEFGVCRRTIFRDLQLLKHADVAVQYDELRGGYRVPRAMDSAVSPIEPEELAGLILACRDARLPDQVAMYCNRAIVKLLSAAGGSAREQTLASLERRSAEHRRGELAS